MLCAYMHAYIHTYEMNAHTIIIQVYMCTYTIMFAQ